MISADKRAHIVRLFTVEKWRLNTIARRGRASRPFSWSRSAWLRRGSCGLGHTRQCSGATLPSSASSPTCPRSPCSPAPFGLSRTSTGCSPPMGSAPFRRWPNHRFQSSRRARSSSIFWAPATAPNRAGVTSPPGAPIGRRAFTCAPSPPRSTPRTRRWSRSWLGVRVPCARASSARSRRPGRGSARSGALGAKGRRAFRSCASASGRKPRCEACSARSGCLVIS